MQLKVEGIISLGFDEVPEDVVTSRGEQVGIGLSDSGYSGEYFSEKNGKAFGIGYSSSYTPSQGVFGPELRLRYSSGKDKLDATYASADWDEVERIWSVGWSPGTQGFIERASDNISAAFYDVGTVVGAGMDMLELPNHSDSRADYDIRISAGDEPDEDEEDGYDYSGIPELDRTWHLREEGSFERVLEAMNRDQEFTIVAPSADVQQLKEPALEFLKQPIEILDINPAVMGAKSKYCLAVVYDRKVNIEEGDIPKLDPAPIGHYYVAIGHLDETGCVKDALWGMNPVHGHPIDFGEIKTEERRYFNTRFYEKYYDTKISVEKALAITEDQHKALVSFIEEENAKPGLYLGGWRDCIDFTNKVLKVIGLEDLRVTDIIKHGEINGVTLAKLSAWNRSLDNKVVSGFSSAEEVAFKFAIPIDRVVNLGSSARDHSEYQFKIMPHEKYLELRNRK